MRETKLWTWHLIAGVVLFVVLGTHMLVMHLDEVLGREGGGALGVLSFDSMTGRASNPLVAVFYILLLGAALYHGFYGLRTIVSELNLAKSAKSALSSVIVLVGALLFVYGTYTAIAAAAL